MSAMAEAVGAGPLNEARQRRPATPRAAMTPSLGAHVARVATLTQAVGAKAARDAEAIPPTRRAVRRASLVHW